MEPNHLREYQRKAVEAVFEQWQTHNSTLLVQATGLGKTVVAAEVIRRMAPKRTLVVAPRAELIYQAKQRIEQFTGLQCDIEMADQRANRHFTCKAPVVISTIQTQYANGNNRVFPPGDFGLLVVDEAHHFIAPAYRRIIDHYRQNPNLKCLGLTATPNRTDEMALGEIFQSCAHQYEIEDGIKDGYLVDIEQIFVPVWGLDYSHVRTTCGDLNQSDLAAVIEQESNIQGMIVPTLEICWGLSAGTLRGLPVAQWAERLTNANPRRAIVFCASVKQAETFANIMNRALPDCAGFVCESTPKDDRRKLLAKFGRGEIKVVMNCAVLGEGFDDPGVEVIVQAKATKSLLVYQQQIGRATRPLPGIIDGLSDAQARKQAIAASAKKSCLIVDFVGVSGKHKLISTIDVLGGKTSDEMLEKARAKAAQLLPFSTVGLLEKTAEEIAKAIAERKRRIEAEKRKIVGVSEYKTVPVDPFNACDLQPRRERGWEKGKQLTEQQLKVFAVIKLNPKLYTYSQQKQILDEQFRRWELGLCTVTQAMGLKALNKPTDVSEIEAARILGQPQCSQDQARVLRRHGYDPFDFTFRTASAKIDEIAKNGWKRPEKDGPPGTKAPEPKKSEPVFLGDRLSEKEINFLAKYHYPRVLLERVHQDEGRRIKLRIINNKFKPLPPEDPDHPKNWKPTV